MKPKQEFLIPGMVAGPVSIDTGLSAGDEIQWGAGHDSFYEVVPSRMRLTLVSHQKLYPVAEQQNSSVSRSLYSRGGEYYVESF